MKRKQVWRYYCDFCKKKTLSAGAMTIHEKHCTMNPNRDCRMCNYNGNSGSRPMNELLTLLPHDLNYEKEAYEDRINASLPELREATNNCPACIMAALRQAK